MILKLLLSSFLLALATQASTINIKKIQNDFYKKVTLKSAHAKKIKKFTLTKKYFKRAKKQLFKKRKYLKKSQFVSLIDLSRQVMILSVWDQQKKDFFPIGFDYISSGDINREIETKKGQDHYVKTPQGFFKIKSGWRSYGETNKDNIVKPYGRKGLFIFNFGIQNSVRYHTYDKNGKRIKNKKKWKLINAKLHFAMHAHSTTQTLGIPRSHGCIRMSEPFNKYLDNNFVFFNHLYKKNRWTHPYQSAPKHPRNQKLAGQYLMVRDKI